MLPPRLRRGNSIETGARLRYARAASGSSRTLRQLDKLATRRAVEVLIVEDDVAAGDPASDVDELELE